jgi:D-beta-D-heptose 7-phosphate kinase/D-beta-D-heptose 1-phosphate adenosyltransferase
VSMPSNNEKLATCLDQMRDKNIIVIGDIMLDRFVFGSVHRMSPEAPVPVLATEDEKMMLGGAGNVLANLASLGAKAKIISVIGDDEAGRKIQDISQSLQIDASGLVMDSERPSICKTRFIAQSKHLLRVDDEDIKDIASDIQTACIEHLQAHIAQADVLILSDYGKGVLTDHMIKTAIAAAKQHNVSVLVDPKRKDYRIYAGADLITPNRSELSAATNGMAVQSDAEIEAACQLLLNNVAVDAIVATRSEAGISVIERNRTPIHIVHNASLDAVDVSGAGDTVMAVLALAVAVGANLADAAALANVAGGVAVSKVGTSQVTIAELKTALIEGIPVMKALGSGDDSVAGTRNIQQSNILHHPREAYVCDDAAAAAQIKEWQAQGLKVGFTNGCFDILHFGHVSYLNKARDRCDRLVLGLNHDQSVRILKGPERPVNDQDARAAVIGALGCVDMVVFFGATEAGADNTPCAVLEALRPDVIFKGGDYKVEDLPEAKVVLEYGGAVEIMPLYEGHSTTGIIDKMKEAS